MKISLFLRPFLNRYRKGYPCGVNRYRTFPIWIGKSILLDRKGYPCGIKNFFLNLASTIFTIFKSYFTDLAELARNTKTQKKCFFLTLKRTMDLIASFVGLIFFGPVILLVGMIIKFNSPGPVFYKQERVGKNGKIFIMYKLRTMIKDAESLTGPTWAKRNDPRITRVGRLLRRYHIDELPQLFNVLKGEMSLVGPRPERPQIIERFNHHFPNYNKKLDVKPGITGYAQIRYKYDETLKDVKLKLKYELFYIQRMCLFLDLKVLLATLAVLVTGKDDYTKAWGG